MVGAAVVPEGGQREKASTFAELVEHVTLPAWRLQERLLDSDKALRIPGRKVTEAYTLKGAEFGHRNAGIEWNVAISRPQAALAQPAAQPAAALPGPRPSAPAPTAGAHVDVISTPAGKKLHLVPDCHHVKGKATLSTQPYDRERHARQDLCSSTKCKAMAHLLGCEAAPRAQPPCASSC